MHPVLFGILSVVVLVLWGGFVFCLLFDCAYIYISLLLSVFLPPDVGLFLSLSPCVSQSLSLSLNQVSK